MSGQCCKAAASVAPGAALLLLPKCPLCLAAWLTAATGLGFSATGAVWVRATVAILCIAAMALAARPILRSRGLKFASERTRQRAERPPVIAFETRRDECV